MKIKKILNFIFTCFFIMLLVAVVGARIIGYKGFAVKTASMEPEVKQGSLIYVKIIAPQDVENQLVVGDDLTYNTLGGEILTHRIVDIDKENKLITTKSIRDGATTDASIPYDKVIGKRVLTISYVGYLVMLLQNIYFLIMLLIVVVLIMATSYMVKTARKTKAQS